MIRQTKNKSYSVLMMTAAMLLVACEHTELANKPSDRQVPLVLNSGISTQTTRAFDATWDANDQIGVFTTVANTPSFITYSGDNLDANKPYKTASLFNTNGTSYQTFSPTDGDIYLPADGSAVDVYAYYPYADGISDSNPFSITLTPQTTANQKAIDILTAKATKCSDNTNPIDIDHNNTRLLFTHCLSKVIIKVKKGEGYADDDLSGSNISGVQLTGQPTTAEFKPIAQELRITGTASTAISVQELESGDADFDNSADVLHTYRAIILPNDDTTNPATSGTQRQIIFSVGSITYTYNVTQTFSPAQQTTFTITLAATEISVSAAITPWAHATPVEPENPLYPDEY